MLSLHLCFIDELIHLVKFDWVYLKPFHLSFLCHLTHRSCQSYRAESPSQPGARGWVRASSRWLWWSGRLDSEAPPSLGFWLLGGHRTWRLTHYPDHCLSPRTLSSWWQHWGLEEGPCCPMRPLGVTNVGKNERYDRKYVNNNHGGYVAHIGLS